MQGIHTLLRASDTDPDDFIFLADRLSTLVIEHALSLLPYREKAIETRTGIAHVGMELDVPAGHLCGVSILRSGASLEKGLRRVVEDVPVGSVLVQSDASRGEPLLYQVALPQCLTASRDSAAQSYVLLLDSQIGTGAAALMAVRILLDHGVLEEHIIVSTILVSRVGGVWALKRAFRESIARRASCPFTRLSGALTCASWSCAHSQGPNREQHGRRRARRALGEDARRREEGAFQASPASDVQLTPPPMQIFTILPGMGSFGDRYFRSEHSD